jgi:hypothetical protein
MNEQRTIHRHPIFVADRVSLWVHPASEVLSVAPARDGEGVSRLDVWTTTPQSPGFKTERRELVIVGTGNPVPAEPLRFIGTCVMPSGLVWHVFEIRHG